MTLEPPDRPRISWPTFLLAVAAYAAVIGVAVFLIRTCMIVARWAR